MRTRLERTGGLDGHEGSVVVEADEVVVQMSLAGADPEIALAVPKGTWVLRRRAGCAEWGTEVAGRSSLQWRLEGTESEDVVFVTATGSSEELVQAICIATQPASNWVEVTESLSSRTGALPPVSAFESRWRLLVGGGAREVFSPNLMPVDGDLVGQHMFRAPVLVAEAAGMGVALAVDISALSKPQAIPAGLGLLRLGGDEVELVVGLHAQERRGHVFHRACAVEGAIGARTLSYRYHVSLFPEPKPGASLKAARKKIWSIGEISRLDGRLEQPGEEYARQIYPGVLERLWVESAVDARRVGAIVTNRSYRGDVWFSCWFNPLRSSYGLYHYGMLLGRDDWVEKARATRALALSAPLVNGFFPTVFVFGEDRWVESHHQGGAPVYFTLWICRGAPTSCCGGIGTWRETARALLEPEATPGHCSQLSGQTVAFPRTLIRTVTL